MVVLPQLKGKHSDTIKRKAMSATEHGFVPQDAAGRTAHQKVHLEAQPG